MKKLILVLLLTGCSEPPSTIPPTDPPPPPIDPMPPPQPPEADPSDYIHIDRVDEIIHGTAVRVGLLHGLTFSGWRDPLSVAARCPSATSFLGFSTTEMVEFGKLGGRLTREGEDFMLPQLQKENRRCFVGKNFNEKFLKANGDCARSEMRKTRLTEYRDVLTPHMLVANGMRDIAQSCSAKLRAAGAPAYDAISGFCSALISVGVINPNTFC